MMIGSLYKNDKFRDIYSCWHGWIFGCDISFYNIRLDSKEFSLPVSFWNIGTLGVNILGSFIIGFMFLYFQHINLSIHQKAMFVTGLLGALTTFSTFSWETLFMMQEGLWGRALSNIGLNIFLCLGATFLGMIIFKKIYGV